MSGSGSHSAGGSSSHAGSGSGSHSHAASGSSSHSAGGSVSYLVAETDFFAAFFLFFFIVFLKDISPFLALLRGGTEPSVIKEENVVSDALSIAN